MNLNAKNYRSHSLEHICWFHEFHSDKDVNIYVSYLCSKMELRLANVRFSA